MPAWEKSESQGLPEKDRVIRVLISSTFRDMMRERDLLVKDVFQEPRRKCAKRFVTFTEVDLRRGITEAQTADTQTEREREPQILKVCLAEIERRCPFLLVLRGQRYGWMLSNVAV